MIFCCKVVFLIVVNIFIFTCGEVLIDSDGGYKNIVIGITPQLPESDIGSLLRELEALFQNTSTSLLTASRGNVFFKELVFVIPKKYKELISRRNILSGAKYFKRPDIFLTENDMFVHPYTVQHGGCSRQGLRIHIPRDFLAADSSKKATSFVRQWAHYRYGVFAESGFLNDEVYPACYKIPGTETIKVSDCTNDIASYTFREGDKSSPSSCSPVPVSGKNDQVLSSIMTSFDFPKMRHFCDNETHPHNRIAPTKQNALCEEKSTWEIISSHNDFKEKRKSSSNVRPSIKYILESDPSIIIAVDSSFNMDQSGRMDLVRNAFNFFTFYNLPNNSTVGLIDMKDKDANPVMTPIQTEEDAERLILPEAYGYGDICVHCTIQRVIAVLKINVSDIIVITSTDIAETWVANIITMLKSSKVALHVIYFQQKLKAPVLLEDVAKSSGGTFFYIAEAFPPGALVSSLTLLYEAFRSIYESFSWMNRKHVLVDQKTFSNNCSPVCTLSFPTDRSIKSFHVLITGPDFGNGPPVIRDSIILDNGEQKFTIRDRSFLYKSQIPAYIFTIDNPQSRLWNLTFARKPGFNKPIVAIVRAINDGYGDILNMQSWISFDSSTNVKNSRQPPITVYSEIKKDNNPVIGAEVVALIHQASYNKEMSLKLGDKGEGDPDITKNDGIFSSYLTDVEEAGYHSITVVAEKMSSESRNGDSNAYDKELNCCGSFIPASLAYSSGPFKRVTTYQSFYVESKYANINYPPRKVTDLRIEDIIILKETIKCYILKWTAPGENYDKGKAFSYDIKVFNNREDALNDFDNSHVFIVKMLNVQGPLLEPKEAGTLQTAFIELTNLTSGVYFIGMKTNSYSGKASDVSNLVEILHTETNTYFTDIDGSKISYYTFPGDGTTEINAYNETTTTLSSNVGLAIGLSCGILILLIIIGIIIFIYCERNRRDDNGTNHNSHLNHNTKKTESNDALCNGGGNVAIISPVNSWGADSLISHYQTLQKNKNTNQIQNKDTDSISFTSSKYSYDNKIDQNSVVYDPIYFHQMRSQDEYNYAHNPMQSPFSPIYTSSLRRFNNGDVLGIPDPAENASIHSYSANRNYLSRLKTDV